MPEEVPPQILSQIHPFTIEYGGPSDPTSGKATRFRREEIWKGPRRTVGWREGYQVDQGFRGGCSLRPAGRILPPEGSDNSR